MKYYKIVNKQDQEDVCYISADKGGDTLDVIQERLGLWQYNITECSEREFNVMTDGENDFIINVGPSRFEMEPWESAHTDKEGRERCVELSKEFRCVELVYMPVDNVDINEVVYSVYKD